MTDSKKLSAIPIGVGVSLVVTVVTCTWWLSNVLHDLDKSIMDLRSRIDAVENRAIAASEDRFTKTQAAEAALRNAINNPGIEFADPRDPTSTIVVPLNGEQYER